jgi:DNA polymerase-3 subunit gamma/tau
LYIFDASEFFMENYIVSARKYRPDTFSTVVGQPSITATLKSAIANEHLAHAYLFCGPRGVGKTTSARIFAKTINCLDLTAETEPCHKCESCAAFDDNRSYNIHELDAASNNSVDDIRLLVEKVRIPPQIGKYSVYIIDEVHMLSQSAFNAFLKTLEEPPAHAVFILATTEKHKILPTILSRCQIYDFNRIGVSDIEKHLSFVAEKEGVTAEPEALNIIAQKADGAMRDALSIFDQVVSFCGSNVTYKQTISNLNVLDYDYYFKLTDAFKSGDVSAVLMIFNEILDNGFNAHHFVTGLCRHMRDLLICKDKVTLELLEVGGEIKEKYSKQSEDNSVQFLVEALRIASECDMQYKASSNKRFLVELAIIRIAQIEEAFKKKTTDASISSTILLPIFSAPAIASKTVVKPPVAQIPKKVSNPVVKKPENRESEPATKTTVKRVQGRSGISTVSIYGAMNDDTNIEDKSDENNQEATNSVGEQNGEKREFGIEELTNVWKTFADNIDAPQLKSALSHRKPVLKDNCNVEYALDNELQMQRIVHELKPKLQGTLRRELNNSGIQIEFIIATSTDTVDDTPYMPEDKWKVMVKKNPALAVFKQRIGLDFDSSVG